MKTQHAEKLISLYVEQPKPLDRLPYTEEFSALCEKYRLVGNPETSEQEIWETLTYIRKKGRLPRKCR